MDDKKDFLAFINAENEKMLDARNSDLGKIIERRAKNVDQRRLFFQHITILALGFSGLSFFSKKIIHSDYFIIGIISLFLCVFLILTWLKEAIDKEGRELDLLQDKISIASEERLDLIGEFTNKSISPKIYEDYWQKVVELPSFKSIKLEHERDKELRETRISEKSWLDYTGEIIIFIFFFGVSLLFLSTIQIRPNIFILFFVFVILFLLLIQENFSKYLEYISRIISKVKKIKLW